MLPSASDAIIDGQYIDIAMLVNNFTAPASQVDAVVEKILTLVATQ